ncbi:hypothetical protein Y032_0412g981 [Ancylostoma ceylanicum]|uniref:Chromodomain-helicase-DNA-binding protein 1 n=1 Tax=Ancylostoma ceylanicum TaxID=53326 RepID=A0A016X371_9BILA|nr:hypothetical protein Y032_0412g981 [Ancylostoma ceylanicum]
MWQDESDDSSSHAGGSEEDVKATPVDATPVDSQQEETRDGDGSSAGEHDSDYENQEEDKVESEDDNDNAPGSSTSSSSSSSSSGSDVPRRRPKGRLDEKTRKLLEDSNYLRRSSRSKQADRKRKSSSPSEEEEEEASQSEESSSDDESYKRSSKKGVPARKSKGSRGRGTNSSRSAVDYTEKGSDEDLDENDVLEWEDDKKSPSSVAANAETIERVIKSRMGAQGATGSATTCYNVAEKGDPNTPNATVLEQQFLIKWVGWSHLHNTWESEASIAAMGANGVKKMQNFLKKQKEMEEWKRTADKEYIEFYECEQVMSEELCEEYKKVERIVAHQVSRDRNAEGVEATEYYVKWCGLSYSDCTWEDARLLPPEQIQAYHRRIDNYKAPSKNAVVLRKRPKFVKIEGMPSFLQPDGKDQTLRDYQLEGLNWMLHAWCKHNSCILADEMGLGKTIQSIAFLAALYHRYELYGPFLVVVPLSTMAAWQKEFAQWAPDLNLVTYMGDTNSREQIRQFEWYVPGTKKIKVNAVLTTYEILLKDKPFLGSFHWAALAVDEAHRLKNDESLLYISLSSFNCDHRLLITGTPLQNSLKELWALLHFIMPEKFDSWAEFESGHSDRDHKGIAALHRKLEPFLLRRVKKDVEKSLPPKLEQILRVDMTAQQKQYYKWILTKNYRELSKGVKGSINGFVNLVMELKKCCNHTSLVRQYDHFENDPQARLQQLLKSSGKLILLDKLLCRLKDTGHRVLIFSQMVMMLDILQEYLQLRRFPAQRLDGSMRADLRKQALDHYNAEGSTDFAFLLSTRAGGLGINLATADTVIIFDSDWNPQNDLQAMSRAHRIGQTRQVNIYRLVTRNSMEEEIVERAKRKLVLDHLVIQRMDTTGRTVLSKTSGSGARSIPFDKKELNDILKFGAADLFKEGDGEEQEPEVDIDRILSVAETRDADETQESGNELLNSFKYANFSINEEQDVAAAAQHQVASSKELDGEATGADWDEIIPAAEREKLEEEERRKLAADLELAPRQRVKVDIEEADDGDASASEGEAEGGRKKRKKAFGDFSGVEVKRFVRSFRKFAKPLQRLEALAQDAELEEHSADELRKLAEALLEGCEKAEEEHELKKNEVKADGEKTKDRGPSFKFAGVVDVNVRAIRKLHAELEPLHKVLSDNDAAADFKPPHKARSQKGWDVEWTSVDDTALLRGVYKYGLGSWEAIKMDPQLGLADKIFLKDKVRKPQPRHVQQRVDYLLKLMDKSANGVRTQRAAPSGLPRKRKAPDDDQGKSAPVEEKRRREKEKEHSSHHKHHHHHSSQAKPSSATRDKTLADQLALVLIEKSIYGQALEDTNDRPFSECVKMMRPVQKYIKKLTAAGSDKEAAKYLMRLGDNCRDQLDEMLKKKPKTNVRKWYNYMWIFLSKFVSQEPMEMLQKYRELCAANHRHRHREHNHVQKEKSPHKHDGEKKKDKDRDKKDGKEQHKKKHHKEHKHDKEHKEHRSHKSHEGHKDRFPRDDPPAEYRSPLQDEYRSSPLVRPPLLSTTPR